MIEVKKVDVSRRVGFLKVKCFSILYENLFFLVIFAFVVVFSAIFEVVKLPIHTCIIISLLFSVVSYLLFFKKKRWALRCRFLTILKSGCLLLYSIGGKRYTVTMCGKLSHLSDLRIVKFFGDSFQELCKDHLFSTKSNIYVYINTHSLFARGILKILKREYCNQNHYSKVDFEEESQQGYAQIGNHRVFITGQGRRKNKMLPSAYPLWPTVEQLTEFEHKNKEIDFWLLKIPVELLASTRDYETKFM